MPAIANISKTKKTTITVSAKAGKDSTKVPIIDLKPGIFFTVLKGLRILKDLKAERSAAPPLKFPRFSLLKNNYYKLPSA